MHASYMGRSGLVVLWMLGVVAGLPILCMGLVSSGDSAHQIVPLHVRNGKVRGRGLLRHGTLPVRGSVHQGYFYAELNLGTPPKPFDVIIDTGSTITYVPCSICQHCGPNHEDDPFNPFKSSTANMLGCKHDFCARDTSTNMCKEDKCYYALSYAEASSSEGWLLQDLYLLPDRQSPIPIVFGCETRETGEIFRQRADGLLGMGNSQTALHAQLAQSGALDDVFSLCFGFPTGGAMVLGSAQLPTDATMKYTPMKASRDSFYQVEITDVRMGNSSITIPAQIFSVGYGVVMDSGTTFIYLPTVAFQAFFSALKAALAGAPHPPDRVPSDPKYNDICWGGLPEEFEELVGIFPTVDLEFRGGVVLQLLPYRYLFTMEEGNFCLGVFDNGSSGTLIGGLAVRNVMVQYDVVGQRVGFAEAECQGLGKKAKEDNEAAAAAGPAVATYKQPTPPAAAAAAAAAGTSGAGAGATAATKGAAATPPPAAAAAADTQEQKAVPAAAAAGKAGGGHQSASDGAIPESDADDKDKAAAAATTTTGAAAAAGKTGDSHSNATAAAAAAPAGQGTAKGPSASPAIATVKVKTEELVSIAGASAPAPIAGNVEEEETEAEEEEEEDYEAGIEEAIEKAMEEEQQQQLEQGGEGAKADGDDAESPLFPAAAAAGDGSLPAGPGTGEEAGKDQNKGESHAPDAAAGAGGPGADKMPETDTSSSGGVGANATAAAAARGTIDRGPPPATAAAAAAGGADNITSTSTSSQQKIAAAAGGAVDTGPPPPPPAAAAAVSGADNITSTSTTTSSQQKMAAAGLVPEPEPGSASRDSELEEAVNTNSSSSTGSSRDVVGSATTAQWQLLGIIAGSFLVVSVGFVSVYAYRWAAARSREAKGFAPVSLNDTDCELAGLRNGFGPSSGYDFDDQDAGADNRDGRGGGGGWKSSYNRGIDSGGGDNQSRPHGHFNGDGDINGAQGKLGDQIQSGALLHITTAPDNNPGARDARSRGGEVSRGEALAAAALVRALEPGRGAFGAAAAAAAAAAGGGPGAAAGVLRAAAGHHGIQGQPSLQSMVSIPLGGAVSVRDSRWEFEDYIEPPLVAGGRREASNEEQDLMVYKRPAGGGDLI